MRINGSLFIIVRGRSPKEVTMTYVVEVLRQEHRNIEKLLRVLEQELSVFDRGDRPNYEVVVGINNDDPDGHDRLPLSQNYGTSSPRNI